MGVAGGLGGVVVCVLGQDWLAPFLDQTDDPEDQDDGSGGYQDRAEDGLDVVDVRGGQDRDPQDGAAEQDEQEALGHPVHSSTCPARRLTTMARVKVSGTKRIAKARPKVPICSAISLRSTIGPITRNASFAVGENAVSDATTNASASEQIDRSTASSASTITD